MANVNHDLWMLPSAVASRHGLKEAKARVEVIKELGGESRGPAPFGLGLIYVFKTGLDQEWIDDLGLVRFE